MDIPPDDEVSWERSSLAPPPRARGRQADTTQELLGRAQASHELIGSQISWATSEAEKSRQAARSLEETTEEQLLAALLAALSAVLVALSADLASLLAAILAVWLGMPRPQKKTE